MTELLIASKIQMLSKMFLHRREQLDPKPRHDGRFVTMKPRAPTVAARFHDSLQALVEQMSQCNPWFIRCVRSYAFALIFSSSSSEPAADSSASSAPSCCRHHISAKIRLMTSPQIYLRAGHTLQCHATRQIGPQRIPPFRKELNQTFPSPYRCLKPNAEKAAMKFDMPLVLEQIRYSGIIDTVKIRKIGYPLRFKFQQFVDR